MASENEVKKAQFQVIWGCWNTAVPLFRAAGSKANGIVSVQGISDYALRVLTLQIFMLVIILHYFTEIH